MSQLSSYVQNVQRNLNFSIDESSGQTVIKVIDSESEEVIRQIPSEEMLALARRLNELNGEQVSGLLVQSKA
jgi:flagellar protein FlaG